MVIQFSGPALDAPSSSTPAPSPLGQFNAAIGSFVVSQELLIGVAIGLFGLWFFSKAKQARHGQKKRRLRRLEFSAARIQSKLASARRRVTRTAGRGAF